MKRILFLVLLIAMTSGCEKVQKEIKKKISAATINANEEMAQKVCKVYHDTIMHYKERTHRLPRSLEQLNEEGYFNISIPFNQLIIQFRPAQGYFYRYKFIDGEHFIFEGVPLEKGVTGNNSFSIDETGKLTVF